ncbi:MAG TPA: hypothetical protein VI911_12025 [Patescibacteria group bacterium]|nr:hypothetical protein [Patescibacteria group bacterium]
MSEIRFRNKIPPSAAALGKTKVFVDSTTKQLASIDENGLVSYYGANINDPKVITVAKVGGEFTTISAALDSIIDSSITNPYVVMVGPGEFVEPLLVVPDGVVVTGFDNISTIVVSDGGAHSVFDLQGQRASLSFLSIKNTASGYAGVIRTGNSEWALIHKISFYNCDIGVLIDASGGDQEFYLEYVDMSGSYTNAVKITSSGGNYAFCNLENFYTYPTGTGTSPEIHLEGVNSSLEIIGAAISGNTNNCGILVTDGASLFGNSIVFNNCDKGVCSDTSGTGASIILTGTQFRNCTLNLDIDNANTVGYYSGYMEYSKANIDSDSVFFITNRDTKIVTVAKKGGDFISIEDALDAIVDSSNSNRYLITIGPGTFTENPLIFKEGISLEGAGEKNTIISCNTSTGTAITGIPRGYISNLTLTGTSGVGGKLIQLYGSASFDSMTISRCTIDSGETLVNLDSSLGGVGQLLFNDCTFGTDWTTCFKIVGAGNPAYPSIISVINTNMSNTNTSGSPVGIDISGLGVQFILSTALSAQYSGLGTFAKVSDGAVLRSSGIGVEGFNIGINTLNQGSAPVIQFLGDINCISYDYLIDHPGTTGFGSGSAHKEKISVDESSSFALNISGGNDAGQVVLQSIYQGDRYDRLINLSKLVREEATVGLIYGGELTVGSGEREVDIAAGSGFLIDSTGNFIKEIMWEDTTLIVPALSESYIYINTNSVVSQSSSQPNTLNNIFLGRVLSDTTDFDIVAQSPIIMKQMSNNVEDMLRIAFGGIFVSGSIVSENTTTPRQLDVSNGQYYFGTLTFNPSGGTSVPFIQYYKTATTGYHHIDNVTTINDKYDDGSGTLADLGAGEFAKHSLYLVGDGVNEKYLFVYSQNKYASLVLATNAGIPIPPSHITDSIVLIATIITQGGEVNLEQISDERPRLGFKPSNLSAVSNHGDLTGLTADDHTHYFLVSGGRAMAGTLDMGTNNITNAGTVNGVTIETHQSRHLPNGGDPLTTAAPTTNLTLSTTNGEGNANSLARSNHSHALTAGVVSSQIPDQANAEGSSANIARADHIHNIPTATVSSVGSANAKGSAASFALSDHVHNHGDQTVTTHHAVATTSANGFMSSTDKTKLDNMQALVTSTTQASTVITYESIVQLTTPSLAIGTYTFKAIVIAQSVATQTGSGFRLGVGTASIGSVGAKWHLPQSGNGTDQAYVYDQTSPTDDVSSTTFPAANTNQIVIGDGVFTISSPGTIAIQFRSETGGAITVQTNSVFQLWKVA